MHFLCFPEFLKSQTPFVRKLHLLNWAALWRWWSSSNQSVSGMKENCPMLIWPLENLRRVVRVIDNCVWVGCSVSADNDSRKSQTSDSAPQRSGVGTLCSCCSLLLAGPGCACPRCLSLPEAASPSAIMLCLLIMTCPLRPLWSSFYSYKYRMEIIGEK